MAFPPKLDELGAVNIMLGTIGLSPISSLTGTTTADVSLAQSILNETSRSVQSSGWEFNTECEYPLAPDGAGTINIADNLLRVDVPNTGMTTVDVTQRGSRLYDKKGRTYTFTQTLKADVILALPYDELPPSARHYIAVRAARVFQKRSLGSETIDGFTADDEFVALSTLRAAEATNADHNIFDHPDVGDAVFRHW